MKRVRSRHHAKGGRPAPRAEEVATVRIETIAAGGAGVGRIDGLTCFTPRTAAGDLAQIAYVNHGRYARGRVLQLLEASPDRVEPRCVHYTNDRCGGCQLQHLGRGAQHDARRRIVRDALQRVGHREVPMPDLETGPEWAYRERLTLTLKARGALFIGGLIPVTQPAHVFALEQCEIADPALIAAWHGVRGMLRGLPLNNAPGAEPLRVSLRMASHPPAHSPAAGEGSAARVTLIVIGGSRWSDGESWAGAVMAAVPSINAVWWERAGGGAVCLSGDSDVEAIAFAQVNRAMAASLQQHVLTMLQSLSPARVIDAYSGRGDLAVILAESGVRVTAIEADPAATMRAADRLATYPHTRVVTAMVENAIEDALNEETPAEVVVLNPPRRGVDVRVTAALADAHDRGVRSIVYVSCDPATLSRDLSRLPRWRIAHVRCFDMFPQTAHVETVCVLVPEES